MRLFFDERDERGAGRQRWSWLEDLGAAPCAACGEDEEGYIFSLTADPDDYRRLLQGRPHLEDQPGDRRLLARWEPLRRELGSSSHPMLACRPLPPGLPAPAKPVALRSSWTLAPTPPRVVWPGEPWDDAVSNARAALEPGAELLIEAWPEAAPPPGRRCRLWMLRGEVVAWSAEAGTSGAGALEGEEGSGEERGPPPVSVVAATRALDARFAALLLVADWERLAGGWLLRDLGLGSRARTAHEGLFKALARRLGGHPSEAAETPAWAFAPRGLLRG